MADLRPRSTAARYGWLLVAVIYFLTAATLSYTHRHVPAAGDAAVLAAGHGTDEGPAVGHADICVICRTLGAGNAAPGPASVVQEAAPALLAAAFPVTSVTPDQPFSSASPRAPPRA